MRRHACRHRPIHQLDGLNGAVRPRPVQYGDWRSSGRPARHHMAIWATFASTTTAKCGRFLFPCMIRGAVGHRIALCVGMRADIGPFIISSPYTNRTEMSVFYSYCVCEMGRASTQVGHLGHPHVQKYTVLCTHLVLTYIGNDNRHAVAPYGGK